MEETKPNYTIAFARIGFKPKLGEYFLLPNGLLHKAIEEWLAIVKPSYHQQCRVVEIYIVSDEQIKKGDNVLSTAGGDAGSFVAKCQKIKDGYLYHVSADGVKGNNYPRNYQKIIGKAPKNVIERLITGHKKEGGEVKFFIDERPIITKDEIRIVRNRKITRQVIVPYDTPDTYSLKFNEDGSVMCE